MREVSWFLNVSLWFWLLFWAFIFLGWGRRAGKTSDCGLSVDTIWPFWQPSVNRQTAIQQDYRATEWLPAVHKWRGGRWSASRSTWRPPPYNSIAADNAAHFTYKEDGCYPKPPSYNVATSLPSYDEAEMTKAEAAVPLVPEREEEFKSCVPDTVASLPPHSRVWGIPRLISLRRGVIRVSVVFAMSSSSCCRISFLVKENFGRCSVVFGQHTQSEVKAESRTK